MLWARTGHQREPPPGRQRGRLRTARCAVVRLRLPAQPGARRGTGAPHQGRYESGLVLTSSHAPPSWLMPSSASGDVPEPSPIRSRAREGSGYPTCATKHPRTAASNPRGSEPRDATECAGLPAQNHAASQMLTEVPWSGHTGHCTSRRSRACTTPRTRASWASATRPADCSSLDVPGGRYQTSSTSGSSAAHALPGGPLTLSRRSSETAQLQPPPRVRFRSAATSSDAALSRLTSRRMASSVRSGRASSAAFAAYGGLGSTAEAGPAGWAATSHRRDVDGRPWWSSARTVGRRGGKNYGGLTHSNGSTGSPSRRTSKCKCGPVEFPVLPTRPTCSPGWICSPTTTEIDDMCAYPVTMSRPP